LIISSAAADNFAILSAKPAVDYRSIFARKQENQKTCKKANWPIPSLLNSKHANLPYQLSQRRFRRQSFVKSPLKSVDFQNNKAQGFGGIKNGQK